MQQSIFQHKSKNYDHPVLKIKGLSHVSYDNFSNVINSFLEQNITSFNRKDAGTVFCVINTDEHSLYDHYFKMTKEYTKRSGDFKTWGFDYDDEYIIFISFKL